MLKKFTAMFDVSLPTANAIFHAANILLIVGGFMAAIGTIAAIWTGDIRERFADERFSKNEAATAQANADAMRAKADMALANMEAAKANMMAAQAQNTAEAIRMYSDMAHLEPFGLPYRPGPGISFSTPLADLLQGTYQFDPSGNLHFQYSDQNDAKLLEVIAKFPRFPFAYFALAESRKLRGTGNWREPAQKCKEILEKTTMIEGHTGAHDEVLALIKAMLAN